MMNDILGAAVDDEGFLINLSDWNKDIATKMAQNDDICLNEDHWEVIYFLRNYFKEYGIAPAVRILTKAVAKKIGEEKVNSRYLYSLFPYGVIKQGCRFAGLPKPPNCF